MTARRDAALQNANPAAEWEADHQRAALLAVGLADEFPWGCDAIQHVAAALIGSRARVAKVTAEADALKIMLAAEWKRCAEIVRNIDVIRSGNLPESGDDVLATLEAAAKAIEGGESK